MQPEEKIQKIKELEGAFLAKMDDMRKDFMNKVREIIADVEKKKIENLKKDLGI